MRSLLINSVYLTGRELLGFSIYLMSVLFSCQFFKEFVPFKLFLSYPSNVVFPLSILILVLCVVSSV